MVILFHRLSLERQERKYYKKDRLLNQNYYLRVSDCGHETLQEKRPYNIAVVRHDLIFFYYSCTSALLCWDSHSVE